MNFEDMPPQAQTALMDVAYNHGDSGARTLGRGAFWSRVTNGDYAGAAAALRAEAPHQRGENARRLLEDADLLEQAVPHHP